MSILDTNAGAPSKTITRAQVPLGGRGPGLRKQGGPPLPKRILLRLASGLPALGVDLNRALARFGLSTEALTELPEGELRWSFLYDFWEAVRETSGESGLGLRLGELDSPEYYQVFGHVLTSSATTGDALLHATRFMRLVLPNIELSFSVEGDRSELVFRALEPELLHPESSEFLLAAIGAIARRLAGAELLPIEVRLSHDEPPDLTHHHRFFGTTALYFNRSHNGYVFDSSLLNLPVQGSDSKRRTELQREAEELLDRLPAVAGMSRKVQDMVSEELRGGNPNIDHVADRLGMHPKTLSRRLRAEGTSYQQLLDQLRFHLAERYLREPNLSIGRIASLLGYADTSSFNKAFKRWSGVAPKHYRQRAMTDAQTGDTASLRKNDDYRAL